MRKLTTRLLRREHGAAAVEFALIAPAFLLMIIGIAQLGILFMANAGLRHAVGEAARLATLYPRPTEQQIRDRLADDQFGLEQAYLSDPQITYGSSDGADYAEITVTYTVPLDFVFVTVPPVSLTETRRVFIHPVA